MGVKDGTEVKTKGAEGLAGGRALGSHEKRGGGLKPTGA